MPIRRSATLQADLFGVDHAVVPMISGFRYTPALISQDEEADLAARIAELDLQPFQFHGHLGLRRVRAFGRRYDYSRRAVEMADPIPRFLLPLRDKAAAFAGREADDFVQALATEYDRGAPIGWHRDKPEFGVVVGVSLLSDCTLRLRRSRADGGWDRQAANLPPRSAYVLSGQARHAWDHSIPPVEARRYSVTFRTLAAA